MPIEHMIPSVLPWLSGLHGKIALVTGAGRGIGRACAIHLAAAGADVIAVARTASDLESFATLQAQPGSTDNRTANADLSPVGGRIESWAMDITEPVFYSRIEALPRLDILINNAGMNRPLPIEEVDIATLDQMINLNIRAAYLTTQAAVRAMLRGANGGSIVQMSSQMGHVGAAGRTVYCMTKHAIEGLTKALAVELAPRGIRVNAVAPTFIETDLTRPMMQNEEFRRWVIDSIPLGHVGQPEDVAGAVLYLVSAASRLVTGTSLKVDGGWTAR